MTIANAAAAVAVLLAAGSAAARAQSWEASRAAGDAAFSAALAHPNFSLPPPRSAPSMIGAFEEKEKSRVVKLEPIELRSWTPEGEPAARLSLPASLDALRRAGPLSIGGRDWNIGLAADAEFKYFFLTFTGGGATALDPLGRPKDLLWGGVVIDLPGGGSYRCTVELCLL
ncbi:MAG: hypothetical protein HY077_05865, partial [Elusimicrobia bacterium]|nr:hypothetical protein [Elusimicrobiota bacterium]